MKKSFLCLVGIFSFFSINAFEWGGNFNNLTEFTGKPDDLKLVQNDQISLWTKIPVSEDRNSYIFGDVSYSFKYDGQDNVARVYNNILNLNILQGNFLWNLKGNSQLQLKVGRFPISDGTVAIFNQVSDGIFVGFKNSKIDLSVYGGYTGLLNSKSVDMLLLDYYTIESNYIEETNDFYTLAPKYIPVALNLKIPFRANSFILQTWGFLDANGANQNRFYGTVGLNGYISKIFSYDLVSSFGTINFENISNLSMLDISGHFDKFIFSLSGKYASGKNGSFSQFIGVTKRSVIYSKFDTEYSSAILGGVNFATLIGNFINLQAGFDVVFDAFEDVQYRGVQYNAGVNWNIFSDLRLSALFKQFIGKESNENNITLDLGLLFAF